MKRVANPKRHEAVWTKLLRGAIDDAERKGFKVTLTDGDELLRSFFQQLFALLLSKRYAAVAPLGTFDVRSRKSRVVPNPVTGAPLTLPETFSIRFRLSGPLQRELTRKFNPTSPLGREPR